MATTYAIPDGRVAMAATLYTGTGATASISNAVNGVSFQPDFVWAKARSSAESHRLADSVRGATKVLYSNLTNAEATEATGITAFASNGFTLGSGTPNGSGITYVGWQWKAGGTAVSNTAGSITSQVSANVAAGFSIVIWNGNLTSGATVGHGLPTAPKLTLFFNRAVAGEHPVYCSVIGASNYLYIQGTNASAAYAGFFNNTAPTASVFSLGNDARTNGSGNAMVAYCFAEVAGYSKIGSYTGNGSADGPFVYTAMKPRFIMVKRTDSTSDWYVWDTSRDTYNVETNTLLPNSAAAETSATSIDGLSNGFKCRSSTVVNASGGTYIYYAVAENPLKFANAR